MRAGEASVVGGLGLHKGAMYFLQAFLQNTMNFSDWNTLCVSAKVLYTATADSVWSYAGLQSLTTSHLYSYDQAPVFVRPPRWPQMSDNETVHGGNKSLGRQVVF